MKTNPHQPPDAAELRRLAEERLKKEDGGRKTESETARLAHELQVHQVELEMEREELLQAHARSEALLAQYTDLYNFAPAGYLSLDRKGMIRQLNLTAARLLGAERSWLVNHRLGLFVAEGDRRAFSDFLQKVFASGAREACEVSLPQADNRPLCVLIEGNLSADGQECLVVMADITERRQAEERARAAQAETEKLLALSDRSRRALISVAEDERKAAEALAIQARIATIFITAPDEEMFNEVLKVVLDVMQSPFGAFGFIAEDGALVVPTMTRQTWDKCQVPEKSIRFAPETWGDSSWPRAIREKQPVLSNEPSAHIPEGHIAIQRHISLPLVIQGEVIGLFQVANKAADYTETDVRMLGSIAGHVAPLLSARLRHERLEHALHQQQKRMEEVMRSVNAELEQRVQDRTDQFAAANRQLTIANQELEAFSYTVSHDLRAPLRHVHGYVELLVEEAGDQLSEQARHYLKTISDASREMSTLIDDLLAFSRMGRAELSETRVDLDKLVQATLPDLKRAAPGRNILWKIPPLPAVQGDPAMLSQVLANLLDNAVKYTRPRDPAQIELGCAGQEDGRSILFVRDNGVGFDPQYTSKLFGVFQRLHRSDEFEGTGIGLAIVRRIIGRHGGRTWAEGQVNAGATFYFTLKPAAPREGTRPTGNPPREGTRPTGNPVKSRKDTR